MLIAVGTNHKYSPIETRERLSIPKGKLKTALAELTDDKCIKGAVILSTCNRVEIYANVEDAYWFNKTNPYIYMYKGREAISHLFEVAAGLDSQIIGEEQILEQVKFVWQEAKRFEATDKYTDVIFERAIKTGIKVREETGISAGTISVASCVLELINAEYGGIKDKKLLLIGVGKISELIIRHLKERGAKAVFIANKTYEKARRLADIINAEVVRFDQLGERLKEADVVVSATASPHFILRKEDILRITDYELRVTSPLLIIDLALPRDVEPSVKDIDGVTLFNLDDLDFIIERNLIYRKQEIPKAQCIINKEVEDLCLTEHLELEPEPVLLP